MVILHASRPCQVAGVSRVCVYVLVKCVSRYVKSILFLQANSASSGRRASSVSKASRTCSNSTCTDAELRKLDAASRKDTWQPTKSSATSSKENKAPALTYVTGGQVRGARKPSAAVRQPLKQSAHHRIAANAIVAQTGKAGWTPAHRSKA